MAFFEGVALEWGAINLVRSDWKLLPLRGVCRRTEFHRFSDGGGTQFVSRRNVCRCLVCVSLCDAEPPACLNKGCTLLPD